MEGFKIKNKQTNKQKTTSYIHWKPVWLLLLKKPGENYKTQDY